MSIAHRHLDVRAAEDTLQNQDVATVHHKVASEGMAQNVSALSSRQLDTCSPDDLFELCIAIIEQATSTLGLHGQQQHLPLLAGILQLFVLIQG